MLRVGWFSTGRGEGSRGLLQFIQHQITSGYLNAELQFIFSNRGRGEQTGSDAFQDLVNSLGLPLVTFSSRQFRQTTGVPLSNNRDLYDLEVIKLLSHYSVDICVLAGYMLIASGKLCRTYPLLNLHPALPTGPIGTWQEVIWSLVENHDTHTGAMVHLATEEVDRGPVVSYFKIPITGGDFDPHWRLLGNQEANLLKNREGESYPLFKMIRQAGYLREPYLLLETLKAFADNYLSFNGLHVVNASGEILAQSAPQGICLTENVETSLKHDTNN